MHKVELLRIVVASPGDVKTERDCVEVVAAELNRGLADVLGLRLDVIRWETDAFPGFNADGSQGHIDTALHIEESDLVIGIFWKRFGTPVADAASGTEHEIRKAYHSWEKSGQPQIMVYFNQMPALNSTPEETAQWQQVKQFQRDPLFKQGLWWNYDGASAFEKVVREHLTQYLRHRTTPVEMRVQTVESPLGLMDVSSVPIARRGARPDLTPGLQNYQSPRFGFHISWPIGTWRAEDNAWLLQQYQMQMFGFSPTVALGLVLSGQPVMGFTPNVNVLIEQVGNATISGYMDNVASMREQLGQHVVSSVADEETQSGFAALYSGDAFGRPMYQFQRVIFSGGLAYIATASQMPPMDQVGLRLKDELSAILNSLRLTKT
jgi:hypothetical protein